MQVEFEEMNVLGLMVKEKKKWRGSLKRESSTCVALWWVYQYFSNDRYQNYKSKGLSSYPISDASLYE